jgi:hypothetical protein
MRGFTVVQKSELRLIPFTDPVYSYPVPELLVSVEGRSDRADQWE